MSTTHTTLPLPGSERPVEKLPGHWVLASLGKRVLRPGGRRLTERLLEVLDIGSGDEVVEFAPGMGATARMTLARQPATYTAVERDAGAAAIVRRYLAGSNQRCVLGEAEATGLPTGSATVVYGEAMLTMQPADKKHHIVAEAHRLLRPGGRYGIHEMCITPDDLSADARNQIEHNLAGEIRVGARPLTCAKWRQLLEAAGFEIVAEEQLPMRLLEPSRLIQDEGLFGALRFVGNLLRQGDARRRVLGMRRVFRKHREHLGAVMLVGRKPGEPGQ
ncbi:MAG TPA: class I SAM-dependent methyltransferase [Pirellulales bacterium]|nr:class I SAM-dependent methyltransferase [Pirellulales bacterium]